MAPLDNTDTGDFNELLGGENAEYLATLHARYLQDKNSIPSDWVAFFDDLQPAGDPDALGEVLADLKGPSWQRADAMPAASHATSNNGIAGAAVAATAATATATAATAAHLAPSGTLSDEQLKSVAVDSIRALMLIRAYRVRGHLYAKLDPLGLAPIEYHPELDAKSYGFTNADLDRPIFIDGVLGYQTATLRQIQSTLETIYSGAIGVEFMHMTDPDQKRWIQERIERRSELNRSEFTEKGKQAIMERLIAAEKFEQFLDKKYRGTKRFGLDGGEAMIPALEQILKRGSQLGLEEVVVGMPHRGRLNVLTNFMNKPFRALFSEFAGASANPDDIAGSGDVKYHLGASADREFDDKNIHLSLNANPSHLEAVNPVVLGRVRAKQQQLGDANRRRVMALTLHGDAAFSGQGLVPESLDLAGLRGYRVGGTIHFIVNNQIGFTTNPINSRTGPYCTEVAKIIEAPIFHVNGDDPEAVVHVARVATEFRMEFGQDVIIDMFCYRRFGHNEGDEPAFTQPKMYRQIANQPTTVDIYSKKLVTEGTVPQTWIDETIDSFESMLDTEFDASKSFKPNKADWMEGKWEGIGLPSQGARRGKTALSDDDFTRVGEAITTIPDDFDANRKLVRLFDQRKKMFETGEGFDWGTGEAMAFSSLLGDGHSIRFTGQDVRRGTFSHRHAFLIDQTTEETYVPIMKLAKDKAILDMHDSPLSEAAVLGFEYGYSVTEPNALTLWEAQFGDFSNGAQIIIDQFISSGESKWLRMSGLVMLLPHGYEGQGPEHSSARLERYLQLCAEDNLQVANCTTPANYFHILRRQLHRDFRKPLIIMTPKSLLRHKAAVSVKDDFTNGSTFHRVLYDNDRIEKKNAKRVVLCSGKVYYDLKAAALEQGLDSVYFLRLEQLYPFPSTALAEELEGLEQCEFVWCQEESKNMGAWSFVDPYLEEALIKAGAKQTRAVYVGRQASASPATGSAARHKAEQASLIEGALTGPLTLR